MNAQVLHAEGLDQVLAVGIRACVVALTDETLDLDRSVGEELISTYWDAQRDHHLRQLRTGALKIDRSFVSQLAGLSRDREIVAAVTGMAHALGMTVVVEGVKPKPTRRADRDRRRSQGYLFARPLAPDSLAAL